MFDLYGNADKVDYYEDLSCAIAILSKVLTDIDGYVSSEMQSSRPDASSLEKTETAHKEKPNDILEQIKNCLDVIHGKIGALVVSPVD